MKEGKSAYILFFKYPEPGKIKTRLAKKLGNSFVMGLYREFIRDLMDTGEKADGDLILAISPAAGQTGEDLEREFTARSYLQRGNDLGERMYNALADVFGSGYSRCVLTGSDIPGISAGLINKAFDKLSGSDIVLGPSSDGGYYLLGVNRDKHRRELFTDVPWSSHRVLEKTLENIRKMKLSCRLVDEMNDIDDLGDLRRFYRSKGKEESSFTIRYLKNRLEEFHGRL